MLGLKLATEPGWANLAERHLAEILTDHAFCEQKAASNAISLIVQFPELSELVTEMAAIAQEEMAHFAQVHAHILQRGWVLGRERKDDYATALLQFVRKGHKREVVLVDRLLFAALIEARSCERFRLLAEGITEAPLAAFYRELMVSEATHYTTFLKLARRYGAPAGIEVDGRWQEFLTYEAETVQQTRQPARMHG